MCVCVCALVCVCVCVYRLYLGTDIHVGGVEGIFEFICIDGAATIGIKLLEHRACLCHTFRKLLFRKPIQLFFPVGELVVGMRPLTRDTAGQEGQACNTAGHAHAGAGMQACKGRAISLKQTNMIITATKRIEEHGAGTA